MEKYFHKISRGGNTTALVFVHGILGHYKDTWGEFPSLACQDSSMNHCDVICWGYPSRLQIPRLPFIPSVGNWFPYIGNKMPNLDGVAEALVADLSNPELGGNYTDLILVGHSMGGLVIKRAIISSLSKVPESTAFLDRICHIILYATPSDGVQLPAVLKLHHQAKSIACDESFINELRNQWINRVHTARENEPHQQGRRYFPITAVIGLEDNAVPRDSAASCYTDVVTVPGNHTELCKPDSREHTSFQVLKRVVSGITASHRVTASNHAVGNTGVPTTMHQVVGEEASSTVSSTDEQISNFGAGLAEAEKGNFEAAYTLFEKEYLRNEHGQRDLGSLAFACYHLYDSGWPDGFRRLKQLSTDNPKVADIFSWLGIAYQKTSQWQDAVACYKKVRDLSPAGSTRINASTRLAQCMAFAGMEDEALTELRACLLESQDPPDKAQIYKALGETLLKVRKSEPLLGIACYEKALSLDSTDKALRFNLAYKHSEVISPAVSLFHYKKVLERGANPYAGRFQVPSATGE